MCVPVCSVSPLDCGSPPLSIGLFRQEYWCVCVCVYSVVSDSLWPHGLPGSSVHGIFHVVILEWVVMSYSRGSSPPRNRTCTSYIFCKRADFLPLCHLGKPKNTGVGCQALLQGIFLTQGLNLHVLNLLHCRQILYLISYQGSPVECVSV